MCRQLVRAAQEVYGLEARELTLSDADRAAIAALREHYAGREWRFGANVPASFACEGSFSWGNVSLALQVEQDWDPIKYVRCHPGGKLGQLRENEK